VYSLVCLKDEKECFYVVCIFIISNIRVQEECLNPWGMNYILEARVLKECLMLVFVA